MDTSLRFHRAARLVGLGLLLGLSSGAAAPAPAPDFWARYQRRVRPGQWVEAESASPHCTRQCVPLSEAALRALRDAFERHHFREITTHAIDASPHRSGVCLTEGRGAQSREVCDLRSEPDPRWAADWAALCREVAEIFAKAQGTGPGEDQRQRAR